MVCTDRTDVGSVFACTSPGCGRMLVLHNGGGRTVVQAGDDGAPHRGGFGLVLGASMG